MKAALGCLTMLVALMGLFLIQFAVDFIFISLLWFVVSFLFPSFYPYNVNYALLAAFISLILGNLFKKAT